MDNCDTIASHPVKYERNQSDDCSPRMKMSQEIPEKFVFKEEQSLYRYCDGNLNFSTASHEDDDYNYHKKKMSRDPMSHRIIEKRRRDRMNNCLADLSRLIPADYLKKGRGRIEKTEIIEMAIKHMRHLQSIIANSRLNEAADSTSASSPPTTLTAPRDSTSNTRQPINMEHYRLGYLECLSEAMHFLVEVQGFFAGDSLCVQMINHLHKHCDKLLKGDALNFPRKHNGETTSSNSSTSTTNGNYSNNSPPLGMSNSTGSNSDDNQIGQSFENSRQFESLDETYKSIHGDFRSDRRYSEMCYPSNHPQKKNSEPYYPRYMEPKLDSENRSDSDLEQNNFVINPRCNEFRKEDCAKNYFERSKDNGGNYLPRNYSTSSGIGSTNMDGTINYEDMNVKEENVDGSSQLREMLTSPKSMAQTNGSTMRNLPEIKRNASPMSHTSGCETLSSHHHVSPTHSNVEHQHHLHPHQEILNFKTQNLTIDISDSNGEPHHNPEMCNLDGMGSENHNNMYKFKNTIKQRFSKENHFNEKRSYDNPDTGEDLPLKKPKISEEFGQNQNPSHYDKECTDRVKYPDPLTKERLHLLDRHEHDDKLRGDLRFNTTVDFEHKKRNRYASESDMPLHGNIDPIASRLSFGHKSNDRSKRWEESVANVKYQNSKLKNLSPNPVMPFYNMPPVLDTTKKPSLGLLTTAEYLNEPSPLMSNKFNKLSISTSESSVGIPIFALHSKGAFYIPLTLDQSALAPFLAILGVTKSDEVEEKRVLHPVTISVNFQAPTIKDLKSVTPWKCPS